MIFRRRHLLVAALAASALAALPATAFAQPADSLEKVQILLDWKFLPTFAGFFVAREIGAYERRGPLSDRIASGRPNSLNASSNTGRTWAWSGRATVWQRSR